MSDSSILDTMNSHQLPGASQIYQADDLRYLMTREDALNTIDAFCTEAANQDLKLVRAGEDHYIKRWVDSHERDIWVSAESYDDAKEVP